MPYIKQEARPTIDVQIDTMITYLKSLPEQEQDGVLNYAVTRIIKDLYPVKYFHCNRAMGVLSCIQAELYRNIIGPYEELKRIENGDV